VYNRLTVGIGLTMKLTEELLTRIVDTIVKEADPEQVYLFGSYARGQATDDSDLDLLIVEKDGFGPEKSRRSEMGRLWRALAGYRVPKDILVFTTDEIARWQDSKYHVIAYALKEGKLLYERPGTGRRAA